MELGWLDRFNLFLGHGRALEFYLASVKIMFGIFLIPVPQKGGQIIAFADLVWWYPPEIVAAPFFIIGIVQYLGLVLNYRGWIRSWLLRSITSGLATFLWTWILVKHIEIGVLVTGIMPFVIMAVAANVWIWWKSVNQLPTPGYHGLV